MGGDAWFFWAAWRGPVERIHKEKGLKGEMAQLIKPLL